MTIRDRFGTPTHCTLRRIESIPLTSTGDVDIEKLNGFSDQQRQPVLPRTDEEREIAQIWQSVLKISPVGVYDNFFEVGGHSLAAMQIVSRLRHTMAVQVNLRAFFESPTIASLAGHIQELRSLERAGAAAAAEKIDNHEEIRL